MHKPLLASVVVVLALSAHVRGQGPTDTTAVVASWNIEGFGGIDDDAKIERLAAGLVALDAEVVALQEVSPDTVAQSIVDAANALGAAYAAPVMLDQTADLNLAILHKTGVTVANPRLVDGSDFTLVVVHLKSGRGGTEQALRTAQASMLHTFVRQVADAGDDDMLLVGDFNMIPDEDRDSFRAMNPDGFLRELATFETTSDFTNVNGNFLDGYSITRRRMTEYVEGSFRVYPMHKVYERTLTWYDDNVSDHFPLLARFRITRDAD